MNYYTFLDTFFKNFFCTKIIKTKVGIKPINQIISSDYFNLCVANSVTNLDFDQFIFLPDFLKDKYTNLEKKINPEDIAYIRESAIRNQEEKNVAIDGHTIHFDGYNDQARDKGHTKFLLPEGVDLGPNINAINKEEGLGELQDIMKNIMQGKKLYVRFFCLGPTNSEFSVPCVQLTDSAYVAHSEDLLYRHGYEEFNSKETLNMYVAVDPQGKNKKALFTRPGLKNVKSLPIRGSGRAAHVFDNKVFVAQYEREHGSVLLDIGEEEPKVLWEKMDVHTELIAR